MARPGPQAGSRPPAARRSGWLRLLQGCLQRGEDVLGEGADLVAAGDEVKACEAELGEALELFGDVGGRACDDLAGASGRRVEADGDAIDGADRVGGPPGGDRGGADLVQQLRDAARPGEAQERDPAVGGPAG